MCMLFPVNHSGNVAQQSPQTEQTREGELSAFGSFVGQWAHLAAAPKSHLFLGISEASTQHPLITPRRPAIAMRLSIFGSWKHFTLLPGNSLHL